MINCVERFFKVNENTNRNHPLVYRLNNIINQVNQGKLCTVSLSKTILMFIQFLILFQEIKQSNFSKTFANRPNRRTDIGR